MLVNGVIGDSPSNRLVRTTVEKHISILDSQQDSGCLLEKAFVSVVVVVAVDDDNDGDDDDDDNDVNAAEEEEEENDCEGLESSFTRLHIRM